MTISHSNGKATTKTHNNNNNNTPQQPASFPSSSATPKLTTIHNYLGYNNNNHLQHRTNGHSNHNQQPNGFITTNSNGAISKTNGFTSTTTTASTSSSAPIFKRQHSITSLRSNGSGRGSPTHINSMSYHSQQQQFNNLMNGSSDNLFPLSLSPASISINNSPSRITGCGGGGCSGDSAESSLVNHQNGCCRGVGQSAGGLATAPVKQEQIVYTKETFYSSFDPNQADVPRFELTETEKFMLSLCLSMIRRERNNILSNHMDATEIHQHFMNPHLACDLDDFIEQAYEIYTYLNTDCDLQRLVKGASEFAGVGSAKPSPSFGANPLGTTAATTTTTGGNNGSDLSPSSQIGIDIQSEGSSWPKDSADTADTYDLLKDYLIISPHSYNTSSTSPSSTHLANNNLIGSINYISSNRQKTHHHHHRQHHQHCSQYKPWDHFV